MKLTEIIDGVAIGLMVSLIVIIPFLLIFNTGTILALTIEHVSESLKPVMETHSVFLIWSLIIYFSLVMVSIAYHFFYMRKKGGLP